MPNSLKTKLSKLRYKCQITDEEYQELITKLDGHDAEIRADERAKMLSPYDVESIEELIQNVRAKAIEEFARRLNLKFVELPLDDLIVLDILKDINRVAEQMKGDKE